MAVLFVENGQKSRGSRSILEEESTECGSGLGMQLSKRVFILNTCQVSRFLTWASGWPEDWETETFSDTWGTRKRSRV